MTGKSNAFSYQHSSQHIIIATVISAWDSTITSLLLSCFKYSYNYKVKMWQYNNRFLLYMLIVKAQQMQRFLIALVLSNGSIWERAHRKCLEQGGKLGRWFCKLSVYQIQADQNLLLCVISHTSPPGASHYTPRCLYGTLTKANVDSEESEAMLSTKFYCYSFNVENAVKHATLATSVLVSLRGATIYNS